MQVEHIEYVVNDRALGALPVLNFIEAGTTILIERHQLTVQNCTFESQPFEGLQKCASPNSSLLTTPSLLSRGTPKMRILEQFIVDNAFALIEGHAI
jgi:hypothetical protein